MKIHKILKLEKTMEKENWTQEKINCWQNKTFKNSTGFSIKEHLKKEIQEFFSERNRIKQRAEAADIVILLYAFADVSGFNLQEEVNKKMEINIKRKWGNPDENGVIEHIRETE